MKRRQIQSDSERLKLLTNLVAHPEITNPNGEIIFDPNTIARLQALIEGFTDAVTARKESIFARRDRRREHERALIDLQTEIQILWRTVRGRVRTGKTPPSSFVLYGLDAGGNQAGNPQKRGWLTLGEQIVNGDLTAEASGSPSLGETTRTSLTQTIATVRETIENLERGNAGENETIQQLATLRDRVDNEIRRVTLTIGLAFADHTSLEKRKAMRILGFTFAGDPTVPIETDESVTEQTA